MNARDGLPETPRGAGVSFKNRVSASRRYLETHPHSLMVFSPTNPVRLMARQVARSAWFDVFVFAVIVANTGSMASENMRGGGVGRSAGQDGFEKASTALFAAEAVLKILDQGLLWSPDAYLSSGWNQFDFLLVLGTISSLFTTIGSQFMAMRAVRCFRPLRAMKNFRDGQLLMRTTLTALPLLRDALIFLGWFMLVASVSGTMVFAGKLTGRCVEAHESSFDSVTNQTVTKYTNATLDATGVCPDKAGVTAAGSICDPNGRGVRCDVSMGERCCVSDHQPSDGFLSFDDFGRSVMIVLNTVTIDGWNELAANAADAAGFGAVFPYFAAIVFFGGFYVIQLFQSVMIITLSHTSEVMDRQDRRETREVARRARSGVSTADLQNDKKTAAGGRVDVDGIGTLINLLITGCGTALVKIKLKLNGPEGPGNEARKQAKALTPRNNTCWRVRVETRQLVNSRFFQRLVLLTIMCNTITMALDAYGQSKGYYSALSTCEFVFTSVFILEFVLKHVALGLQKYWANPWNVLDGVVVVSGVAEMALGSGADGIATLRTLRVLRIFAGLKGLRKHRAFRQVFAAVVNGVRRIVSFCLVFFLFLTVFAILGMQLFGGVFANNATYKDARAGFDTFGDAVLTLFVVCTGENTFTVGWDLAEASGTQWAVVYVASWSLVSTSLLALVLGVLIQATKEPVVMDEFDDDADDADDEFRKKERENNKGVDAFRSRESAPTKSSSSDSADSFFSGDNEKSEPDTAPATSASVETAADAETLASTRKSLRHECEVEVAAVRLWLDEFGFTVVQREVLRVLVVDGEVTQNVTRAGETADDVRGRFSTKQLRAARERLTAARIRGVIVDRTRAQDGSDDDYDDGGVGNDELSKPKPALFGLGGRPVVPLAVDTQKPTAIKFGMGGVSKVSSVAGVLARKAESRFEKLRSDKALALIDPKTLSRLAVEKRAREVGIAIETQKFRFRCLRLIEHPVTRNAVLGLIVVSACLLAPQCDRNWPIVGSTADKSLNAVDYFFNAAFFVEMSVKLVAYTAWSGPKAYLKDGWNVLDGFIVAMSLLTVALSSVAGGVGGNLKVFRVLRVLRPLRVIKNVPSLKLVIDATLVSLPSILTVCALGAVCFIILGVLGMAFFRGGFRSCSVFNDGGDIATCAAAGGEFINAPLHFDNIGQAIVSVFVMSTGDNWQDIMYLGMDSRGEDREPRFQHQKNYAFFFVLVVVVAFFFWANLFVSSLVDNFSQVASEIGSGDGEGGESFGQPASGYAYSESQRRWMLAMKAGWRAASDEWRDANPFGMPLYRRVCFYARRSRVWEPFVLVFITANAVQLCFYRANAGVAETNVMTTLSVTFAVLYVLETVVNVTAMTWVKYWESGWHKLDFTVTVVGVAEILLLAVLGTNNSGFVTVFRTVRFFRLFKLLKTSPGLRSLTDTFLTALPGMMNILGLMGLMMHIYACLGCTLFGDIPLPYPNVAGLTEHWNFHNWGNAMALLFVSLSGNWSEIFKDAYWMCATGPDSSNLTASSCDDQYRLVAVFYFFSFIVFAVYLLANLFVAILIERFDYCSTMEGVYDKQDPFDALVRLNVLRKIGTKIRNRLRLARTLQTVTKRRNSTQHAAAGEQRGFGKRTSDPNQRDDEVGFVDANKRLREIVEGPRLKPYKTLRKNLSMALAGFGSVTPGHAMDLVEQVLDADAKGKRQEEEAGNTGKRTVAGNGAAKHKDDERETEAPGAGLWNRGFGFVRNTFAFRKK